MLQDLIVAAVSEALRASRALQETRLGGIAGGMAGGLGLPGL
jgi:nucleoid-associated protein EbfC